MWQKRFLWILIGIGITLRLYQFASIPISLNRDEAALGYNAYAIANYGMDEWGKPWPLTFKSFGDYKLPGYIYLDAVIIKLFGVHDWTIRLPSLIAGIVIIYLTYLIVNQWFHNRNAALISASLIAIEPWAVFYSRMAYEANVGLCFFLISLYCLSKPKVKWITLGLLSYIFAVATYNAPLILSPLLMLFIGFSPVLNRHIKSIIVTVVGGISLISFILLASVTYQKQSITIFSDPTLADIQAKQYHQAQSILEKVWWHRETFYLRTMTDHWIASWSPAFLTIRGGQNPWHSIPGKAHLYWLVYILGFIGIINLSKASKKQVPARFLYVILIIGSLIPAIITVDAPHATRSLFFLWLFPIFAAYAITRIPRFFTLIICLILIIEMSSYANSYFDMFAHYHSGSWPVGLRESLLATKDNQNKKILIDGNNQDITLDQIYIYPLLYWQISPLQYQRTVKFLPLDAAHLSRVQGFNNLTISRTLNDQYDVIIQRKTDGSYAIIK